MKRKIKKLGLIDKILLGIVGLGTLLGVTAKTNAEYASEIRINNVGVSGNITPGQMVIKNYYGKPTRPSSEGKDLYGSNWDSYPPFLWDTMFMPYSDIFGEKLIVNFRPGNSTTSTKIYRAIQSVDGKPRTVESYGNYLLFEVSDLGKYFTGVPITYQLPNGQRYKIDNGTNITQPDVVGTFNSREVFQVDELHFRNLEDLDNNGKSDFEDFSKIAQNWFHSISDANSSDPNYLLGDIASETEVGRPDGYVGLEDLVVLASEWLREFPVPAPSDP